jgi:hypothetical protein
MMGRRSWLDVLTDLVDRVPLPRWLVYASAGAVLALVGTAAGWLAGRPDVPALDALTIVGAALPMILLWSMQALDDVAVRALATLRPLVDLDDAAIGGVANDLRRTPPGWAAAALIVGVAAGLGSILGSPSSWALDDRSPGLLWAVGIGQSIVASVTVFAFLAHVVHQLRLVDDLHRRHVRIDLFRLEPLYAFATLTARTGLTLLAIAGGGFLVVSSLQPAIEFSFADFSSGAVLLVVAIACFVAPLLSLHNRIVAEKDHRVAEANETLRSTLAELRRRVAAGEMDEAAKLNDTVAAANAAVIVATRVSTWPWRPETLRAFAGAVVLPVCLWLVFELLRRVLPA